MIRRIQQVFLASFVSAAVFVTACASSSDGKTDGGSTSTSDSSSSSSMTTCQHASVCVGSACKCVTEGPKKDQACCDPSDSSCSGDPKNCDSFCEVCTSS
ncbi:MAG: hypothetical protein ABIP39_10915 [Polyangiaceae bacterium]